MPIAIIDDQTLRLEVSQTGIFTSHRLQSISQLPVPAATAAYSYNPVISVCPSVPSVTAVPLSVSSPPLSCPQLIYLQSSEIVQGQRPTNTQGVFSSPPVATSTSQTPFSFHCNSPGLTIGVPMASGFHIDPTCITELPLQPMAMSTEAVLVTSAPSPQSTFALQCNPYQVNSADIEKDSTVLKYNNRGFPLPITPYGFVDRDFQKSLSVVDTLLDGSKKEFMITRAEKVSLWRTFASAFPDSSTKLEVTDSSLLSIFLGLPSHIRKAVRHKGGISAILKECPWFYVSGDQVELVPSMEKLYQCQDDDVADMSKHQVEEQTETTPVSWEDLSLSDIEEGGYPCLSSENETVEPESTHSLTRFTAEYDGRSSRNDKRDWNERREAGREVSEKRIMKQEKPGNDTQEKGACEVKSYASGRSVLDDHVYETDYVVRDENNKRNPSLMTDKSTEDWKCVQKTGMAAFDREKQECVVASRDEPRENETLNTSGWEDSAAAIVSNSLYSPGKHLKFGDTENSKRCGGRGNQGLVKIEDGSWYVVDEVEEVGEEGEMGWGDDSSSQCQTWDEVDDTRALRELIMDNEEKEIRTCSSQKQFNMEGHRQDEINTSFIQAGRRLSENHKMIQTVNRGCWNEDEVSSLGVDTVRSDVSIQTSILIPPPVTAKTLVDHSTDCADLEAVTEASENTECRSDQCKKILGYCQSDLLKVTLEQREADAHLTHVTSKLKHIEEENRRLKDELSSVITDLIKQQQKPKTEEKTTTTEINCDMVKMLQRSLSEAKQNLLHCNLKNIDLQAKLALQLISQAYEESEIIYSMKRLSISKKASLTMQMMKYQGQLQSCKETVDGWKMRSERMLASGGSIHTLPLLPPIDIDKFTPKFKPSVHGPLRHPTQPSAANIKLAANFSSSVQTDRTSEPQQVEKEKKEKMSQHATFILSADSEDAKIPLCSTFMPNSKSDRPGSEFQPDFTASRFVGENNGCHLAEVETKNIPEGAKNQDTAAPKKVESQLRTDPVVTPHHEPRTAFHSDSSLLYEHDPAMSLYHHPTGSTKHGSTWQNSYLGQEVPPHRDLPSTSTSVEVPNVQPSHIWHTGELFYDKNNPNSYYSCQHKQPDNRIGTSDWMGQPIDLRSGNTQRLPGNIRVDTQHFTPKPLPENIQGELMAFEPTIIQGVCSEQTTSPTSSSNMECMPNVHYIGSDRVTVNVPTQVQRQSPTNPTLPVTAMQTTVPADSNGPCNTNLSIEASRGYVGTKVKCPSSTQKGESLQKYVIQDTRQEIDYIQIRGEIGCPSLTEIQQVTQAKIPRQDLGPTTAEKDHYRNLEIKVGPPISPALQNIAGKKEIVVHPHHVQKVARASVHSNVGLDTFEKEVTRAERKKRGKSTLTGTTDRGSGWLTLGGKRKKKQNERESLRGCEEVIATTRPPIEDDVIPTVFSLTHLLKKLSDMFPKESRLSLTSAILKVRANHRGQLDKVPYAIIISEATVILTSQNDTRQERSKGVACNLNARQDEQEAEEEPRIAPKGNLLPKLLKKMSETFPKKKKKDIIDGIIQVRKTHGGTLAGISMTQVIFEVSMFLKNIGTIQETDDKELQDRSCCKICLGSLKSSQLVRELECLHTFHDECIQSWFQKRECRCPVCRRHALLQEDFPRLN